MDAISKILSKGDAGLQGLEDVEMMQQSDQPDLNSILMAVLADPQKKQMLVDFLAQLTIGE